MMMKKILASIFTALSLVAAPVFAQSAPVDPAAIAATQELFEAMHYRAMMGGMMQQMTQHMGASMRAGAEAAIENNPKLDAAGKKKALAEMNAELPGIVSKMDALLNDPSLIDEILTETVPLYAREFTPAEIGQIAAFYRSPIGAKMLAVTPKLMGEGMQLGQQIVGRRLGPLMQQIQQDQQAHQAEQAKAK